MKFGHFPPYWFEVWILSFAIWLIPVAIHKIWVEIVNNDTLPDEPNTEDEET